MKTILYNVICLVSVFFIAILFSGCESENDILIDDTNYYPLLINQSSIYQTKEEVYEAGKSDPIISTYYEKHLVKSIWKDDNGFIQATVNVYKSSGLELNDWVESSIYKIEKRPDEILVTKDGQTTSILKFPLRSNNTWNVNDFNENGNQVAVIKETGNALTIGNNSWDNVVTVVYRDKNTLIDLYQTISYFAPSMGLVYEIDAALEYCQDSHCIGDYVIESGYQIERILIQSDI